MARRSLKFPRSSGCSKSGLYWGGAIVAISSLASRMWAMSFEAPMFTLIFASSSTTWTSKWPPFRPRFLPNPTSRPDRLAKSFDPSVSLNGPRTRSGVLPHRQLGWLALHEHAGRAAWMACRIVGSAAMRRRSRLMALLGEVLRLHRVARRGWPPRTSAPASSWNSASITTMTAIAPRTITRATPRSARRRARTPRPRGRHGGRGRPVIAAGSRRRAAAGSEGTPWSCTCRAAPRRSRARRA